MYTIKNNSCNELIIKNSKFICLTFKINNDLEISNLLEDTKKKYPKATHYCYAYIINNIKKANDDGEPSSTAGMPILRVIEKNNLTNILVIVVRYFGGIKLGANGLIRAYSKVTSNSLENNLIELLEGYNIDISFEYSRLKEIDYLLKDITINKKEYNDIIIYNLNIPKDNLNIIINANINYNIIKDIYIEKEV